MTEGRRGGGSKHLLQKELPVEERNYYAHFPIRGTRGKRQSLLVSTREEVLLRAQGEAVNIRVLLAERRGRHDQRGDPCGYVSAAQEVTDLGGVG